MKDDIFEEEEKPEKKIKLSDEEKKLMEKLVKAGYEKVDTKKAKGERPMMVDDVEYYQFYKFSDGTIYAK